MSNRVSPLVPFIIATAAADPEDDDQQSTKLQAEEIARLGTIRVVFRAFKYVGKDLLTKNEVHLPGEAAISEKSKKAGSHSARYVLVQLLCRRLRQF